MTIRSLSSFMDGRLRPPVLSTVAANIERLEQAAREAGAAEADARWRDVVTALQSEHANALAVERERWSAEEGQALAEALQSAVGDLASIVDDAATTILMDLFRTLLPTQSLSAIRAALATAMALQSEDKGECLVRISGASDLAEAVAASLAKDNIAIVLDGDADGCTVAIDATRLRSRFEICRQAIVEIAYSP